MSLLSRIAVEAARGFGILARTGSPTDVPASYLVVAGGGGGGFDIGGGGGAGGLLASTATLSTLNTYSITVGAGGAGSSSSAVRGSNGVDSSISGIGLTTVTSTGGGGGGTNNTGLYTGSTGGSGGGSSAGSTSSASGTTGQGNAGGAGNGNLASGGGGGAGAAGAAGTGVSASGNGGNGSASSISGFSVTYAGGGGGGGYVFSASVGTGGTGGGGAGVKTGTAVSGTANLGGGGGGGGSTGGSGGSGIVIISYASATPKFVGGTLTTSGGNQIHTFTSSGTLSPITPVTASYLVVAGGGGAVGNRNGGGGAGGLLTSSTTLYSGATYVVTVGAGGAGGAGNAGPTSAQDGSNSVLSGTGLTTLTATGGGGGGGTNNPSSGRNGGSGGGAGGDNATGATGGTGVSGQGFAGGTSATGGGAGGGGASAVGSNGTSNTGGNGGAGTASSISGTSVTYAGGGGGGATTTAGTGGAGGGGNGAQGSPSTQLAGVSGTQNLGGGAGGGSNYGTTPVTQASGGSGIVIISYAGSQVFNGGLVTSSGGNTIHTFTATGALTPLTNNLNNSLRFRSSASAYLTRTPTLAGNQKTWTWSAWVKRGSLAATRQGLFVANPSGAVYWGLEFDASNALNIYDSNAGGSTALTTTQVFRDPSAWYHIVVAVDTTQATAANRTKLYINGNQVTAFSVANYPSQNSNTQINTGSLTHYIGNWNPSVANLPFDGYMADINFIDGQALEPYYFGNNDANGVWKPIKYTGMYGTNGFYLTFGNTTSTTTLGYDSSGNNNNWTTNNISLTAGTTYDAMKDSPTNTSPTVANYAVLNPLSSTAATLSNANLSVTLSASGGVAGTIAGFTSGKWYYEAVITGGATNSVWLGWLSDAYVKNDNAWSYSTQVALYASLTGNNGNNASYGATYTTNDIIGVAIDLSTSSGSITFYKNGVSQGVMFSSLTSSAIWRPFFSGGSGGQSVAFNFGQRPFSYTPPTGYVALNTYNLPTPTILQGNKYMDATLYTGTATTQVIVNQALFKPDLVWLKIRSGAGQHVLSDSVRGISKQVFSSLTNAETTEAGKGVTAFNSNGFTLGDELVVTGSSNANAATYVGWQWQAGQGSTSSNTQGSITSTVSVNTTAGFSVVTYTGNGTNGATVGHGLGVVPKMVIVKNRSSSCDWIVAHTSLSGTNNLYLNGTFAASTPGSGGINALSSSSTFSCNNTGTAIQTNQSGQTYVAYCWAEIAGFSRFGSYTGNANADGPFIYTGFRPKFVLFKRTDSTSNWEIQDASRGNYNVISKELYADLSDAEYDDAYNNTDFLSNGFKIRSGASSGNNNPSGGTVIYAAFAENPFKNANAR